MNATLNTPSQTKSPVSLPGTGGRPPIGEWFRLKDPTRTSFELDPEHNSSDALLWCGDDLVRQKLLKGTIEVLRDRHRSIDSAPYNSQTPHLLFVGDYGTGKTHAWYHIDRLLEQDAGLRDRVWTCRLEWTAFSRKTRFSDVYRATLQRLGYEKIKSLVKAHLSRHHQQLIVPGELGKQLQGDSDLLAALKALVGESIQYPLLNPSERNESNLLGWRWLQGLPLTIVQRTKLGVAVSLAETQDTLRYVSLLRFLGFLSLECQNRTLLLFYDEAEQLSELSRSPDAKSSFGSALRALFDRGQTELGIVLGMTQREGEEAVLFRADLLSRLDRENQFIKFDVLDPTKQMQFTRKVLAALARPDFPPYHPFHEDALRLFVQNLPRFVPGTDLERNRLFGSKGEVTSRTIMMALAAVTSAARRHGELTISEHFIRTHFVSR